jgi:hypothetical protein
MRIAGVAAFRLNRCHDRHPTINNAPGRALLALSNASAQTQTLKDWQNPHLTGINNQLPHATMVVCPDAKTALRIGPVSNAERMKSPFYRSLNGE